MFGGARDGSRLRKMSSFLLGAEGKGCTREKPICSADGYQALSDFKITCTVSLGKLVGLSEVHIAGVECPKRAVSLWSETDVPFATGTGHAGDVSTVVRHGESVKIGVILVDLLHNNLPFFLPSENGNVERGTLC